MAVWRYEIIADDDVVIRLLTIVDRVFDVYLRRAEPQLA